MSLTLGSTALEIRGKSIAPLKIRELSFLRISDPDLFITTHLFFSTRVATLLRQEMRPAQYTSATLRPPLATQNTIRFLTQCVQDVSGNQDVFTQMCTNSNSTCALCQILSSYKKKIASASTRPNRRSAGSGSKLKQRNT